MVGISLVEQAISFTVNAVADPEEDTEVTFVATNAYENVFVVTAVTTKVPLNVVSTPETETVCPTVRV
jgi:hypothetical protein